MTRPRLLIAGIGNIFLGDDGFGCEVIQQLLQRSISEEVRIVDFGIRGLDLTYALLENYDAVILVDAVPRNGEAGTIYLIEPTVAELTEADVLVEAHAMDPLKVLAMAKSLGGELKQILLVGCEPHTFGPAEGQMGLSEIVRAAVPVALETIEKLMNDILSSHQRAVAGINN